MKAVWILGLLFASPVLADEELKWPDMPKNCDFAVAKQVAIKAVEAIELSPNPVDPHKTVAKLTAIRGMSSSVGGDVTVMLTAIRNHTKYPVRHRMIAHVVVGPDCKVKGNPWVSVVNSSFALGTVDDADKEAHE